MSWGVGDAPWDFNRAYIAANDGDGTFGTSVRVFACQMTGLTIKYRSGTASGDGGLRALAAKIESIEGKMRFVGIQQDVLAIVTGLATSNSGVTPNRVQGLPIKNKRAPYFGFIGQAQASESDGDAHMFVPRVKNMSDITINYEENNFVTIELTFTGVADEHILLGGEPVIADVFQHETETAISAFPPADRAYTIA